MSDMEKLAAQVPAIVTEARDHLRKMAHSLVAETEKSAALEKELRFHKLARRMEERRIDDALDLESKLAKLASIPESKLDAFEAALELSPGGYKLGSLQHTEEETGNSNAEGGPKPHESLDAWIGSGQAFS